MGTTGTVPQSFLAQLRARSDDVQAHGYQIAVVFFNSLASDPHQFATEVFNNNGIGSKDKNNGVLIVLYLQKPGTDGHAPWLAGITGEGISTALPDTLLDDYAQATFVPARAQEHWKVSQGTSDPNAALDAARQLTAGIRVFVENYPDYGVGSNSHSVLVQIEGSFNRIEYARSQLIGEQTDFNKWLLTQIPMMALR